MDVVVAGCGWLGRAVATALADRGDRVVAVRRSAGPIADLADRGIEIRGGDLLDPRTAEALPDRADAIVACQSADGRDAAAYRRAYVDVNRALLSYGERSGAERLVYTGSTGVFGRSDGSTVDETTAPEPAGPTGAVLLEAESIVRQRGSVVRLSGLYGPGRYGTIERVRTGALALGPGDDAWMNFCHLEDAVRAVVAALDRGRTGAVYHGTDASPTPRAEVVRWIADRLGIEPPVRTGRVPTRGANRRVDGRRTREELGLTLAYPSFREGFAAALDGTR